MTLTTAASNELQLPAPERASLHRFTLFEKTTTLNIEFGAGVYCLAGANGLGKSTFLASLNYAMTGVVAEPGREFRGVEDYYRKVKNYSQSYFRGRIGPNDIEAAYVELGLRVGNRRYRVRRGVLEPSALLELEISRASDDSVLVTNDPDMSGEERQALYASSIVTDCGLESFAQLVFLQHFVLTFDERRQLLFWGARTLPAALFIAFGLDPVKARRADRLQEVVRGADSLARNYSWQASDWRRQLENLEALADEVATEDKGIGQEHKQLLDEQEEAADAVTRLMDDLASTHTMIAESSAQLQADRLRFDEIWDLRLRGRGHPSVHPVITTSIADARCSLCGTDGEVVVGRIQQRLDTGFCPLCESALGQSHDSATSHVTELAVVDERISELQTRLSALDRARSELGHQIDRASDHATTIGIRIAEFERENDLALLRGQGDVSAVAERYQAAMNDQLGRKREQMQRRDDAQRELRKLQRDLVASYSVAEESFVPAFTRLAEQFLGLTLDVELEARKNDVQLLLTVQGTQRRAEDALSESQRFFLDIALRMALVSQMASAGAPGVMYIDTPEGSLDIAYEAKAGEMFGTFARDGHGLIMTANINTSKLLERLAKRCGRDLMILERMTQWTVLSQVQAEEETLFDEAFAAIESALDGAGG